MDELNPTAREQEIYEEMELTPEMIRSIRTLCGTCLRHFVDRLYRPLRRWLSWYHAPLVSSFPDRIPIRSWRTPRQQSGESAR